MIINNSFFNILSFIDPNLFQNNDVFNIKLLSTFSNSLFNYKYIQTFRQHILRNPSLSVSFNIIIDIESSYNNDFCFSHAFDWRLSLSDILPLWQYSGHFLPESYFIKSSSLYINHLKFCDFSHIIPFISIFGWNYLPLLSNDNILHISCIIDFDRSSYLFDYDSYGEYDHCLFNNFSFSGRHPIIYYNI